MGNDAISDKSGDNHKNECNISSVVKNIYILVVDKVNVDKSNDQITLAGKE